MSNNSPLNSAPNPGDGNQKRENGGHLNLAQIKLAAQSVRAVTKEFARLSTEDVPLLPMVRALESQFRTSDPALSEVLSTVAKAVEGGKKLHEALAQFPLVFHPVYTTIIWAAECDAQPPPGTNVVPQLQTLFQWPRMEVFLQRIQRIGAAFPDAKIQEKNLDRTFALVMGTLLQCGTPCMASLDAMKKISDPEVAKIFASMREDVRKGAMFSDCMTAAGCFNPSLIYQVREAEEVGNLEEVLLDYAK